LCLCVFVFNSVPFKNSLLFPLVQSVHIIGIAMLVGPIVLVNLRVLGILPQVRSSLKSWTRAGLAIMLTTGTVLFASDVSRYVANPAFLFKMAVLLLALLGHFTLEPEKHGKLTAVLSILLWTCVVIGGRAIADFDV
jgi:hypothetical protein